jgi:hypothetical protein
MNEQDIKAYDKFRNEKEDVWRELETIDIWEAGLTYERERTKFLIETLEIISNSKFEANPWTIVATKDAVLATEALNKYKGTK